MVTMEELLASQSQKITTLRRGQEVEGEIVSITDKEITLDLGTKSEGVIQTREIPKDKLATLKVGDKLKAFVYMQENESGQVVLSLERQALATHPAGVKTHLRGGLGRGGRSRGGRFVDWSRFTAAQNQKSKLKGRVLEVNKGGLIVEVDSVRGFLPNSQVGFELLSKAGAGSPRGEAGMESLIGQDLEVVAIEVDSANNKLIFSERGQVSDEVRRNLKKFNPGQKAQGKLVAILPFGLVVNVAEVEGLVFISDVSWEKVDDLAKQFSVGQEIEILVLGLDEELGRLNLSIKQLTEDPFEEIAKKYPTDEVVKGEISSVSTSGVAVKLEDGAEGFLPVSKMDSETIYEAGKVTTFLVDSVDSSRRRVNLAPFVTSTAGLIYK